MLTCKELTELITDYLEGRMSLGQRLRFQLHLGMCRRCRIYLRQMKMTIQTLGKLPDEPIPADVREELLMRFRSMRPARTAAFPAWQSIVAVVDGWLSGRGWIIPGGVLLAAALLAVALGGESGPLVQGSATCLLTELGAGAAPVAALILAATVFRGRVTASSLAAVAALGALAGYLSLLGSVCPYSRVTPHVLLVHVGGILAATLLGALAARLPWLRPR